MFMYEMLKNVVGRERERGDGEREREREEITSIIKNVNECMILFKSTINQHVVMY